MSTKNTSKTKAERREAARAEAMAFRAAQDRRDKRNRILMLSAFAVGLVGLLGVIVYLFVSSSDSAPSNSEQKPFVASSPKPLDQVTGPSTADDSNGIPVGADGVAGTTNEGAPRVDVYLDFMCPLCGQFEEVNGTSLDDLRTKSEVTVVYHPVGYLDSYSQGSGFSTRSASAAALIAEEAPDTFLAFMVGMFDKQPAENTPGLTDAEMQKIATEAGVPSAVAAKIGDGTATTRYSDWVTAVIAVDSQNPDLRGDRGFGTPTILVDGEKFTGNWTDPSVLATAIEQAAAS